MLQNVVKIKQGVTCKEAVKASGYKGPAELMAMYLCFLKGVDRTSTDFLRKNVGLLKKTRADYKKQHLQNPVLRELVKLVREGLHRD